MNAPAAKCATPAVVSEPLLQLRGLNQSYGGSHTLWDIDLDVPAGSCTTLMGRNGMGKTTLLKCVMGLLPASGSIRLGGQEIAPLRAEARAGLKVGYVPQGREIFPQLTVEENLRLAVYARPDRSFAMLDRIYTLFPVLRKMARRRGGDLSGGQQQQLAIGRALVLEPQLLILDEPTEGIQPNIVQEIGDIILRLNRDEHRDERLTVLLVEQKLPFARRVGSDFRLIDKGRMVAAGPMTALSDELIRRHLTV